MFSMNLREMFLFFMLIFAPEYLYEHNIKGIKGRFFDPWILITLISVCAPGLTLKTLKENVD